MKKGEYADEKIILLRRNCQKRIRDYDLLTDEIPVRGKKIRFHWFSLFDGAFRMLLPGNFEQMPEQIAKVRYISSYRPPVILSGPTYEENFGFHLLEDGNDELGGLIRKMQDTVLRHAPETIVYGEDVIASEGMEGRWFEYKNFTVDDETYNIQFLVRSDNRLLAGTFNCRMAYYDEWRPLVLKSLEQIERADKGEKNEGRKDTHITF